MGNLFCFSPPRPERHRQPLPVPPGADPVPERLREVWRHVHHRAEQRVARVLPGEEPGTVRGGRGRRAVRLQLRRQVGGFLERSSWFLKPMGRLHQIAIYIGHRGFQTSLSRFFPHKF